MNECSKRQLSKQAIGSTEKNDLLDLLHVEATDTFNLDDILCLTLSLRKWSLSNDDPDLWWLRNILQCFDHGSKLFV